MDLSAGLVIGRIRGISIRVHWSWSLIFALIAWSLADGIFREVFEHWSASQRWTAGIITAVLFFLSVLVHELAHAFVAQSYGMHVPSITLFIFGGVSSIDGEMRSAGQEFRIAIAGPLSSMALGVLFGGLFLLLRTGGPSVVFGYLGFINFALAIFNLLPGFPLDGGRVFRSIVWARTHSQLRATRAASRLGTAIAYLIIAIGVIVVITVDIFGLWYVLIGLFLRSASQDALAQLKVERALRDIPASQVMRPPPEPIEGTWTLQRVVDERVLGAAERVSFVSGDGRVIGLITTRDLMGTPRDRWRSTRVEEAMVRADDVIVVGPETSVIEGMQLMQRHDVNQLPVLDGGRLVGVLTRADVLQQIELRVIFDDGADFDDDDRERDR